MYVSNDVVIISPVGDRTVTIAVGKPSSDDGALISRLTDSGSVVVTIHASACPARSVPFVGTHNGNCPLSIISLIGTGVDVGEGV